MRWIVRWLYNEFLDFLWLEKMIDVTLLKTAFRKLLAYAYYDKTDMVLRHHVATFAKSIADEQTENLAFQQILNVANGKDSDSLDMWLSRMSLIYLPKSIVQEENDHNHLITNIPDDKAKLDRLIIRTDIPVELLIIDVAWVLKFGYLVDCNLSDNCWGNRIDLVDNNTGVRKGNSLFKKYQYQYKQWWQNGVEKANEHLKNKEDITIINFDITNCYHSIDFDFDVFFADYERKRPNDGIRTAELTTVLQKIYERYWVLTMQSDEEVFCDGNDKKHPMSLSLMSSHILANWYLKPLDDYIENTYHPYYYGRYVDDCMVVKKKNSSSLQTEESIQEELNGMFEWKDYDVIVFKFAQRQNVNHTTRLSTLTVQTKKLYIYRFNSELPQSSIDKYAAEQMERSSEYRFITDEMDADYAGLEFVTLINALDAEEDKGRRFSILEENGYKLSVYLAKLSARIASQGKEYEHYNEVGKVYAYFQGALLIKHYQLWERLMTLFVLGEKKDYVDGFFARICQQIDRLDVGDDVFRRSKADGLARIKECLRNHLNQSYLMAMSLNNVGGNIDSLYLDTFMVRMHYNTYPMQEFADRYKREGVMLDARNLNYDLSLLEYRWMPYYIKLYDVISLLSVGQPYEPSIIEKAFEAFQRLNGNKQETDYLKALFRHPTQKDNVSEFNTWLETEPCTKDDITVSVVNMDVTDLEGKNQIDIFGNRDKDKVLMFQHILDQITKIESTDVFILPEMTLPYFELREYCRYAASRQVAFVAGMEYIVKDNRVYNYIVTCLPLVLYGQMDAIPVIRLKNHYAPDEIKNIEAHNMKVPVNRKTWQNLYHWHNHVFTTYYCYELANIIERSCFFSMIDAMYCPVFNRDTYYYNNIAESLARDMHCYFVLSNVSHYGDSRVTQPSSHDRMNLLKVKGGNTDDNRAVVFSAKLKVKALRDFQTLDDKEQKTIIDDKDYERIKYKQTPPDYDRKLLYTRKSSRFLMKAEDVTEDFFSKLYTEMLQYTPKKRK